jgi:hypothetical protein
MDADDEYQRAPLLRESESTFWWAWRARIKWPMIPIISDDQRSLAVSTESFRLSAIPA